MARARVDWFSVVEQIEAGDDAALLRLTGLVSSLLVRIGAYRGDAEHDDLIQEITLSLIQAVRRDAIRERSAFVGYAWSVARNRWLNLQKSRSRGGPREENRELEELSPGDLAPGSAPLARDPAELVDLERSVDALPPGEREAISAIYLEGHSYEEAARKLGLSLSSLKRRQWKGLRRLRALMQPPEAGRTDSRATGSTPGAGAGG